MVKLSKAEAEKIQRMAERISCYNYKIGLRVEFNQAEDTFCYFDGEVLLAKINKETLKESHSQNAC